MDTNVNKSGFWVEYDHPKEGLRTYACADRKGLDGLIYHLTGRDVSTFMLDSRGLPNLAALRIRIAPDLHIWSASANEK